MKYCTHCGKELLDEAVVCSGCGCAVEESEERLQTNGTEATKSIKFKKIWMILGAVALVLVIIVAILFVPRNLKMDDFKKTNVVTAIIKYGLPKRISSESGEVTLFYGDKVDFYGITPYSFSVSPDDDTVAFYFDQDDAKDVYNKIERYCDVEQNSWSSFHIFSYENMEITTFGSYVTIEID